MRHSQWASPAHTTVVLVTVAQFEAYTTVELKKSNSVFVKQVLVKVVFSLAKSYLVN